MVGSPVWGFFFGRHIEVGVTGKAEFENGPKAHFLLGNNELNTQQTLLELVEPAVEGLGYELIDLEYRASGRGLVRLYIDKEQGIGLDDCAEVSHEISALLDVADPIPGQYLLEVSSPGEDRILRKPQHFADFAGEQVKIELTAAQAGQRRYKGQLKGIEGDEVLVDTDDEPVRLRLGNIARARLVPTTKQVKKA